MVVRLSGKKWTLPDVLCFPVTFHYNWNKSNFFYRVLGYRPPKKGEYYLSGAKIAVYKAPNDLSCPYLVVEKTDHAIRESVWIRNTKAVQ